MISGQRTIQSYVLEEPILEKYQEINARASQSSYEAGYYATSVMDLQLISLPIYR
jgi:ATP-binding cassette, subfamily B, multidrug efflux pump